MANERPKRFRVVRGMDREQLELALNDPKETFLDSFHIVAMTASPNSHAITIVLENDYYIQNPVQLTPQVTMGAISLGPEENWDDDDEVPETAKGKVGRTKK